jgi:hypothetical protein
MNAKEYLLVQIDAIRVMIQLGSYSIEQANTALATVANVALYLEENNIELDVDSKNK